MLRSSLPNPSGEAEGLAQSWGGGRNVVSVRRNRTAPNAHRASPRRFPNFGAVAPDHIALLAWSFWLFWIGTGYWILDIGYFHTFTFPSSTLSVQVCKCASGQFPITSISFQPQQPQAPRTQSPQNSRGKRRAFNVFPRPRRGFRVLRVLPPPLAPRTQSPQNSRGKLLHSPTPPLPH